MPKFSSKSLKKLKTCHSLLQLLMLEVVKDFDITIVCGERNKKAQDSYYNSGVSKVQYPDSKHNKKPSLAVDIAPYIKGNVCWETRQCYYLSGYVMATAQKLGIAIRTGADWNSDNDINDQNFRDVCHFELNGELIK